MKKEKGEALTIDEVHVLLDAHWYDAKRNACIENPLLYAVNEIRKIVDDNDKETRGMIR